MSEEKKETAGESKEVNENKSELFDQMIKDGILGNFFSGLEGRDKQEWENFTRKILSQYDGIIDMINEASSTYKGKTELYDEIIRKTVKQ